MHRRARQPDERDVPGDHALLRRRRDARDPQPARPAALVHRTATGERAVLAMLGQRHAEALGVVEGSAHQRAVLDAGPVVGEERDPEVRQLTHRSKRLSRPPHGDGAGHRHVGQCAPAEGEHLGHHPRRIERGLGVGHGHDGGEAAQRRGPGARLDRLGLLAAGLAQMGVQVDQAGPDETATGIEDAGAAGRVDRRADRGDGGPVDRDVGAGDAVGADDRSAPDHERDVRQRPPPPRTPRRGAGTGWPCAPRRRSPPAG